MNFDVKAVRPIKATVIIPAFNRPKMLREALESAISQTVTEIEIIVIDDCSDVDLSVVVADFNDERVRYLRKNINRGVSDSRNLGVRVSKGDWVFFLDDDDAFLPNKIEAQIELMLEKQASVSLCPYFDYDSRFLCDFPNEEFVSNKRLRLGNPYCGASGLAMSRILALDYVFDENLILGEDWDIFVRILKNNRIALCPLGLFYYRSGTHESLSKLSVRLSLDKVEKLIMSSDKNKDWLGSYYYRRRVAGQVLSYILLKENRVSWIKESLCRAGLLATTVVAMTMVIKKIIECFDKQL